MGLSTASLHLYGANLAQLAPLLPDSLLLREHNAPWLTLLLPESEEGGGGTLEKLAKKLTKADPEAAALLFVYFDDEMFTCSLYWGGKKAAGCLSGESWAKLGKALDVLFGDDLAGKAFRYAARCVALEEKLRLLEESVGVALLDCPEFEPRTVPRGDGTLRAVKARESALRKRPNQCVLTELPVEGWPLEWQTVIGLYNQLRSDWIHNEAADLPFEIGTDTATVPRFPDTAFHKIPSGGSDKPQKRFLTWSHTTGALKNWTVGESNPYRPLWLAGPDALVCLASVPDTRKTYAEMACTYFSHPSSDMKIIGCTRDKNGKFYDSRACAEYMPRDVDVNAAWNIARRVHRIIRNIREFDPKNPPLDEKGKPFKTPNRYISQAEWLKMVTK